jgi:hypothetical protein
MPRRMSVWPVASHTHTPEGTGIIARQRLHHRRGQPGRRRWWDAQASNPAELDLDCLTAARRNAWPAIRIRRHHHGGKTATIAAQFLAPAIDLTGTNIRPARYLGNNRLRRKCRCYHPPASAHRSNGGAALRRWITRTSPSHRLSHRCKHRRLQCAYPARSAERQQGAVPRRDTVPRHTLEIQKSLKKP